MMNTLLTIPGYSLQDRSELASGPRVMRCPTRNAQTIDEPTDNSRS
jgi:hypothetical protein